MKVGVQVDAREVERMTENLKPSAVRAVTKKAFRKASKIVVDAARKNFKQEFPKSKWRAMGIVNRPFKKGHGAIVRVYRSRKRTGKSALDEAYLLTILEKGAAAGGTRDRMTKRKGKTEWGRRQEYSRGRIQPRKFFAPAVDVTISKAQSTVREMVMKGLEERAKKV